MGPAVSGSLRCSAGARSHARLAALRYTSGSAVVAGLVGSCGRSGPVAADFSVRRGAFTSASHCAWQLGAASEPGDCRAGFNGRRDLSARVASSVRRLEPSDSDSILRAVGQLGVGGLLLWSSGRTPNTGAGAAV